MQTYTIAIRKGVNQSFEPVKGIPQNMPKIQAESLASQARKEGLDAVAFNVNAS